MDLKNKKNSKSRKKRKQNTENEGKGRNSMQGAGRDRDPGNSAVGGQCARFDQSVDQQRGWQQGSTRDTVSSVWQHGGTLGLTVA